MLLGYARVSSDEQETHLQIDALKATGCERIYQEKASGAKTDRPELMRLLDHARKGDVVVVWRLDRLGRPLLHLIETVNLLHERGVQLRSLTENLIDTTTPKRQARVRNFRSDGRVRAGSVAAAHDGWADRCEEARAGWGKTKEPGPDEIKKAKALLASGEYTKAEVAAELGASRHTLWRALASGDK